jgi:hypothetical protein
LHYINYNSNALKDQIFGDKFFELLEAIASTEGPVGFLIDVS